MKVKAEVNVKDGDSLEIVHHKAQKEKYIPFRMVGSLGYSQIKGATTMDSIKLMMDFNANEAWLMNQIKDLGEGTTLVAVIRGKTLTPVEKKKLSLAYKTLRQKDIIRRVKREYYMVNPMFWVPRTNREALTDTYNSLK